MADRKDIMTVLTALLPLASKGGLFDEDAPCTDLFRAERAKVDAKAKAEAKRARRRERNLRLKND